MADYPTIQNPSGLQQKIIKTKYKGISSSGYMMTRAKATASKKEFLVKYTFLTNTERDTLQTFFDTNQGLGFNWTHPESGGETYFVVFIEDELEFTLTLPYYWILNFKIREV